jgi:hypothetical protein
VHQRVLLVQQTVLGEGRRRVCGRWLGEWVNESWTTATRCGVCASSVSSQVVGLESVMYVSILEALAELAGALHEFPAFVGLGMDGCRWHPWMLKGPAVSGQ